MNDKPKSKSLREQLRDSIRMKHYSYETEKTYVRWVERFVSYHNGQHPSQLGGAEIAQYLSYLAVERKVAPNTQNQALNAIVYFYRHVLRVDVGKLPEITWAKCREVVHDPLSRKEVAQILAHVNGKEWLMIALMYGCGLRKSEVLRLRIKDLNFNSKHIVIRDSKGHKDRIVPIPAALKTPLRIVKANAAFPSSSYLERSE